MTLHAEESKTKKNAGNRIALLGVALIFGIVLIAAFMLLSRQSENARNVAVITPSPARTAINANQEQEAQPQQPREPAAPLDAVAIVNDHAIDAATARVTLDSDRAMARLLKQPPPDESDILDRLINRELILQAAEAAGFSKSPAEIDEALAAFLARQQLSARALNEALAAEGISVDDFKTYFGDLITADAFSRAQAEKQGVAPSAYIDQLQADARISYGPAAGPFLLQTASQTRKTPAATAAPQATPTSAPTPIAAETETADVGVSPGQTAPDFTLPLVNGEMDALTLTDLQGRPVVLSFWTTWCPYCRRQTPVLVAGHQQRPDKDIQFIGIDVKDDRSKVASYIDEQGIPYPIVLDEKGEIAKEYEVKGFPTTYFLDSEGRIVAVKVGALTAEQLENYLQKISN